MARFHFLAPIFLITAIAAQTSKSPLPIPDNFDFEAYLFGKEIEGKIYHSPRPSARFCEDLLANGTAEDIALVEKIIPAVLTAQIADPDSPYYGAFKWELEMEAVEDLNAVEFLLFSLIPIILQHEDKLSDSLVADIRESIRMGLFNIASVDVNFEYTNIVSKDITNTILGGELLNDPEMAQRGYDKLERWMEFTDRSGGAYEFNSLPYTAVTLDVLHVLQTHTRNESARVNAKILLARFALSAGLHIHTPTGRWAGPHSRAYHGSVTGNSGGYRIDRQELESYNRWLATSALPNWLGALVEDETLPDWILETTDIDRGIGQSTYKTDQYALGVATRDASNQAIRYIAWQSNVFTLHYTRPQERLPGSLYTRYILDDHWLGDFSPGEGRGAYGLIPDDGHFQGVQDRERAIALYCPTGLGGIEYHSSAKAVVALPRWKSGLDEIWIGEKRVEQLPAPVEPGETVAIASGDALIAIKPLKLTQLSEDAPMRIKLMEDNTLVMEMYNYQGPRKIFWELAHPSAFFKGQPQCGFYAEIADRESYENGAAFARKVDQGTLIDIADPRATFNGENSRKWKVEYERDDRKLGIEVDLYDWFHPAKRWTHEGELGWPMLQSSRTLQSRSGRIEIDGVRLTTISGEAAWLYVSPNQEVVAAAYHGPTPSPLNLDLPNGSVRMERLAKGIVVWQKEGVSVDAIDLTGTPEIMGNVLQ